MPPKRRPGQPFLNTTAYTCLLQDFFKSPAAGREGLKLALTPKSKGRTLAAEAGAASAAKSAPRSAVAGGAIGGRSRLSQAGPSMAPAAFDVEEEEEGLERTQEIELPQGDASLAAAAQASARKSAPLSASRRRSLSRTPGTKIVIIERGTGGRGTPASAARAAAGASAAKQQTQVGIARLPCCLHSCLRSTELSGCRPHPLQFSSHHPLTDPTSPTHLQAGCQTTPRLLSTITVQTEAAEECGEDDVEVEQERSDEGGSAEEASPDLEGGRAAATAGWPAGWQGMHLEWSPAAAAAAEAAARFLSYLAVPAASTLPCLPRAAPSPSPPAETAAEVAAGDAVPLKQYQRALLRAKAFHGEARQLASQLRRMTARAAKLKKAAAALRFVARGS